MSVLGAGQGNPSAFGGGGAVGLAPTSTLAPMSLIPPTTQQTTSLGPDWLALIMVVSAGVSLGLIFAIVRLGMWISLRRPIPMTIDDMGTSIPNRTLTRKILCFPGVILRKVTLRSFHRSGIPPVGMILLIFSWIGFSLFATFFRVQFNLQEIAYRLPYVGMANIPILFLSTLKNSPLGYIAGLSYEKINSFHRWVGRLIVATFLTHGILMGVLMVKRQSTPFSIWIARKDVQWGISAVSCLLLLFIFSNRWTRTKFHEFFRLTHIILTVAFLFTAYYHQPQTMYPIIVSLSLLGLEWFPRFIKMMLPIPKAATTIYPGNVVRLSIPIPSNPISKFLWRKWSPGAHVRITVPCIGILQPHPFTIASLPSDGHMQLYIRSREGLSRRLYEKAAASVIGQRQLHLKVHLEGIYGAKHHSFTKFDVVLLIASGIGVTFTIPILQELVQKAKILQQGDCRCRRIGFVWVVKHKVELSWFSKELSTFMENASGLVAMRLYITRDELRTPTSPDLQKDAEIPSSLVPFLRHSRPSLQGLVEQAADEAVVMGRLGVGVCGNRGMVTEVKNAVVKNVTGDMPDIYCHAEEFEY